jgi:hypothetical protein
MVLKNSGLELKRNVGYNWPAAAGTRYRGVTVEGGGVNNENRADINQALAATRAQRGEGVCRAGQIAT